MIFYWIILGVAILLAISFYGYRRYKMTGLQFEGVGAPRGVKSAELVSAVIYYSKGGKGLILVTLIDGTTCSIPITDKNIGILATYIRVLELDISEEGEAIYPEHPISIALESERNKNKLDY